MKKRSWMIVALLTVLMMVCSLTPALASSETSQVIYEGDAQKFVFVPASTDLFGNFKGVMPGDVLSQKITVRNKASNGVKVKIYLQAQGVVEQTQDFLSQLKLKVVQQGSNVLFDAPADQTAGLTDPVCLGTFYSGAEVELEALLEVPITLYDTYQDAMGTIRWVFTVEEYPIEPTDPKPPVTGEQSAIGWYVAALALAAAGLIVLLRKKKADRDAAR